MNRIVLACVFVLTGATSGQEPALIVKPDAFKTLVSPNCSHCRDEAKRRVGELREHDQVLCWIRGKYDGGAIPYRFFLNPFRVISDTYGVFVYDPDAGYARGYAPSLDFTFHGWRAGVMVMKHKDGTLFSCLSGRAFDGPRKGIRLEPIPTLVSEWSFWLDRYPGGVAYQMFDKYQPIELPTGTDADSLKSRRYKDKRLPADALVLGVADGADARAYTLDFSKDKAGLLQDHGSGRKRVVLWYGPTRTAAAYEPIASPPEKAEGKPRTLTIEIDQSGQGDSFRDKETGSRWDITGRAVAGELKGWTLRWLDSTQVKWFAWAAEYPHTAIHGQ